MSLKSWVYKLLAFSNDLNAVEKKKVTRRIGRRAAGKATGKVFRGIFK